MSSSGLGHVTFIPDRLRPIREGRSNLDWSWSRPRWWSGPAPCETGTGLEAHELLEERRRRARLGAAGHFRKVASDLNRSHN